MRPPARPLFLARDTYRRRRLIDAIRLVPVLGAILFMVPVLSAAGHVGMTFRGGVYLFGSWLLLIVLTAVLERRLRRTEALALEAPEGPGEGPRGNTAEPAASEAQSRGDGAHRADGARH